MELKELVGKHFLSGIERGRTERKSFFGATDMRDSIKFCLDGVNYVAVEDPCDGWRSFCEELEISEIPCKIQIPKTEVLCTMKPDDDRCGVNNDVLVLTDCETGLVVLEVGTANTNDYYPYCVMEWTPENLSCNRR